MATRIPAEHFTKALYLLIEVALGKLHGFFLDRGTSIFEALATISAPQVQGPE